jgi:hypothetical protein
MIKKIAVKVGKPISPYVNAKALKKLKHAAKVTLNNYEKLESSANAETLQKDNV